MAKAQDGSKPEIFGPPHTFVTFACIKQDNYENLE